MSDQWRHPEMDYLICTETQDQVKALSGLSYFAYINKETERLLGIFKAEGNYIRPVLFGRVLEEEKMRSFYERKGKYLVIRKYSTSDGFLRDLCYCDTKRELKNTLAPLNSIDLAGVFRIEKDYGIVAIDFREIFGLK
ncbi:MAG: hypothetical protein HKP41_21815 [Desulfobacterales bacterium]|nr:hypothetical protein [Desulfobacterales bacterium]